MKILLIILILSLSAYSQSIKEIRESIQNFCKGVKNCKQNLSLLSQSFYLSADNYQSKNIIHPIYEDLYKLIKPAGVLVNLKTLLPISTIQNQKKKLQKQSKHPLFFGGDNCQASYKKWNIRFRPEQGLTTCQTRVRANLAKMAGCNYLFNPQVESSISTPHESSFNQEQIDQAKRDIKIYKKAGVLLTIKHFPYTHKLIDNHKDIYNLQIPYLFMAINHFSAFKEFSDLDLPIMTTHLVNTFIDNTLVTFSKKWTNILKEDLGFKRNLLITDSINMFKSYPDEIINLGSQYPWKDFNNQAAAIFIRSVLAGHDIVINRESSHYQISLIKGVVDFLNSKHPLVEPLKQALKKSKKRILNYKKKYKKLLTFIPKTDTKEFNLLISGYSKGAQLEDKFCQAPEVIKILKKIEKF